jgi:tetratricopeptide (TPR) repeat protein
LQDEEFISEQAASDVVDLLAKVLGKETQQQTQSLCTNCGKEVQPEWKTCPYCATELSKNPPCSDSQDGGFALRFYHFMNCVLEYINNNDYDSAVLELDKAILECNKALQINPKNADAFFCLGEAYTSKVVILAPTFNRDYDRADYDKALENLTRAIQLKPDFYDAVCKRSDLFDSVGEYDKAISDINEAARIDPENSFTYTSRAYIYINKGDDEKALSDFNYAVQLAQKCERPASYFNRLEQRGNFLFNRGKIENAISDYSNALQISSPEIKSADLARVTARLADAKKSAGIAEPVMSNINAYTHPTVTSVQDSKEPPKKKWIVPVSAGITLVAIYIFRPWDLESGTFSWAYSLFGDSIVVQIAVTALFVVGVFGISKVFFEKDDEKEKK